MWQPIPIPTSLPVCISTSSECPIARARALYAKAADARYLKVAGVSVHIGSQITDVAPFAEAGRGLPIWFANCAPMGTASTTSTPGAG